MTKGLIEIPYAGHDEWLAERKKRIGGSDAAAVCGLSKWASPYSVWAEKRGLTQDREDSEAMRQGRDLEEYVARRFAERTGKRVRRKNSILVNPAYPFAHANVDRLVVGEDAGLECKTTSSLNTRRFRDVEFPEDYYAQCLHYLAVTGAEKWYLAVLVLGREFHVFELRRDEAEIAALMRLEADFWRHVEDGTEPPVDGSIATGEALDAVYPTDGGGECDLNAFAGDLQEYLRINDEIADLKKQRDEHANAVKAFMGDSGHGDWLGGRVNWSSSVRETVDSKRLAAERPDIYRAYIKTTNVRTFKVTAAR